MHQGKYRLLSFILVIMVFMTGLYLDTIQSEDAFFLYDSMGEAVPGLRSSHADINNAKLCGQEMLGEYAETEQQPIELHALFTLLYACRVSLSRSQGKFNGNSEEVQPFCQTLDGLVTIFMHQSDGKKRN